MRGPRFVGFAERRDARLPQSGAYDKFRLSKEDYELRKALEEEQKKAREKAEREKKAKGEGQEVGQGAGGCREGEGGETDR